jgi:hypothetical protein
VAQVLDAHGDPRPALAGDLNLDGTVTIADFITLASNFNASGIPIGWQEGDVNYDGRVTIADFLDLSANFNTSFSGDSWPIAPHDRMLLESFAASVPEPAAAVVVLLPICCLAARRRRCPNVVFRSKPQSDAWLCHRT